MLNNFFPYPYFDMKTRDQFIDAIIENYPFVKHGVIAKSLCGRNIDYLQIGRNFDSALFVATVHGMEWLTGLLILTFFETLCNKVQNGQLLYGIDVTALLNQSGLFIIPCLNPDGVEISLHGAAAATPYENLVKSVSNYGSTANWQANARGVDLNHNFDAGWEELHELEIKSGITGPSPTRYGGPYPESEPETKALVDLCMRENFRYTIAFHSQGEEIYWNYGNKTPIYSRLIANILAKFSGYTVSEPEGLAIGGGFKDWFIKEFHRPGFTIEIGKGKNPLPVSDLVPIYNRLEEMMLVATFI